MLESVVGVDARGFFASVAADGDARRICGLSPIYTLLRSCRAPAAACSATASGRTRRAR